MLSLYLQERDRLERIDREERTIQEEFHTLENIHQNESPSSRTTKMEDIWDVQGEQSAESILNPDQFSQHGYAIQHIEPRNKIISSSLAPLSEIVSVQILTPDPNWIRAVSVTEIVNTTPNGKHAKREGTLDDPRLGPRDRNHLCATCGEHIEKCEGHRGHIELPLPVYNVLYMENIIQLLRSVCFFCARPLLQPTDVRYRKVASLTDAMKRLAETANYCKTIEYCGGPPAPPAPPSPQQEGAKPREPSEPKSQLDCSQGCHNRQPLFMLKKKNKLMILVYKRLPSTKKPRKNAAQKKKQQLAKRWGGKKNLSVWDKDLQETLDQRLQKGKSDHDHKRREGKLYSLPLLKPIQVTPGLKRKSSIFSNSTSSKASSRVSITSRTESNLLGDDYGEEYLDHKGLLLRRKSFSYTSVSSSTPSQEEDEEDEDRLFQQGDTPPRKSPDTARKDRHKQIDPSSFEEEEEEEEDDEMEKERDAKEDERGIFSGEVGGEGEDGEEDEEADEVDIDDGEGEREGEAEAEAEADGENDADEERDEERDPNEDDNISEEDKDAEADHSLAGYASGEDDDEQDLVLVRSEGESDRSDMDDDHDDHLRLTHHRSTKRKRQQLKATNRKKRKSPAETHPHKKKQDGRDSRLLKKPFPVSKRARTKSRNNTNDSKTDVSPELLSQILPEVDHRHKRAKVGLHQTQKTTIISETLQKKEAPGGISNHDGNHDGNKEEQAAFAAGVAKQPIDIFGFANMPSVSAMSLQGMLNRHLMIDSQIITSSNLFSRKSLEWSKLESLIPTAHQLSEAQKNEIALALLGQQQLNVLESGLPSLATSNPPINTNNTNNNNNNNKGKFAYYSKEEDNDRRVIFWPADALDILKRIKNEDLHLLGLSPESRPDWLIWECFPVSPPYTRMATTTGDGSKTSRASTDATKHLNKIITCVKNVKTKMRKIESVFRAKHLSSTTPTNVPTTSHPLGAPPGPSSSGPLGPFGPLGASGHLGTLTKTANVNGNGNPSGIAGVATSNNKVQKEPNLELLIKSFFDSYMLMMVAISQFIDSDTKHIPSQNQRVLKGLTTKMKRKEGRVRSNVSCKRVNHCGRTVIVGADASLDVDEIGVPIWMAMKLTRPVRVTRYNINHLQKLILNGPDHYPGATQITKRNGTMIHLSTARKRRFDTLRLGDIVHCQIVDGDIALINRQPSLHAPSIMAHRIRVLPAYITPMMPLYCMMLNLSCTKPYNADFDGDEMNLHIPQGEEAEAEAASLMKVENMFTMRACMGPVQDSQLGAFAITSPDCFLTRQDLTQILMQTKYMDLWMSKHEGLPIPAVRYKDTASGKFIPLWCGKQILSFLFPQHFSYSHHLEAPIPIQQQPLKKDLDLKDVEDLKDLKDLKHKNKHQAIHYEKLPDPQGEPCLIVDGVLLMGRLMNGNFGATSESLVQKLCLDFGTSITNKFLSDFQRIISMWWVMNGFSMGLEHEDMVTRKESQDFVNCGLQLVNLLTELSNWNINQLAEATAEFRLGLFPVLEHLFQLSLKRRPNSTTKNNSHVSKDRNQQQWETVLDAFLQQKPIFRREFLNLILKRSLTWQENACCLIWPPSPRVTLWKCYHQEPRPLRFMSCK